MVGLNVRLEYGSDRRTRALGRFEVTVDELDMRIDDGETRAGEAPEQVARARRRLVQERTQDHCLRQR